MMWITTAQNYGSMDFWPVSDGFHKLYSTC